LEKQRVDPTQNPNRDDQPRSPELSCNFARSAQDARADCASNAHSNPKTNANDAARCPLVRTGSRMVVAVECAVWAPCRDWMWISPGGRPMVGDSRLRLDASH